MPEVTLSSDDLPQDFRIPPEDIEYVFQELNDDKLFWTYAIFRDVIKHKGINKGNLEKDWIVLYQNQPCIVVEVGDGYAVVQNINTGERGDRISRQSALKILSK